MTVPATAPAATDRFAPFALAAMARGTALAALLALIVLGLAWELVVAPIGRGTLAIKVLPLLACVPGLLRTRLQTFRVLSLLVWLYVAEGLVRVVADPSPSRLMAGAELLLCAVLFAACVVYIRRRPGAAPRFPA